MKKQLWLALAAAGFVSNPLGFAFADDAKPAKPTEKVIVKEKKAGEPVRVININGKNIDLEQLKKLGKLEDLKALEGMEGLEGLKIDLSQLKGLEKLSDLKDIEKIVANGVGDFTFTFDEEQSADNDKDGAKKTDEQKKERRVQRIHVNRPGATTGKNENFLGVSTEAVPEILYSQVPNLTKGRGVLISMVTPKSAAEKAGLKKNDILLSVAGQSVSDPDQLRKIVTSQKAGAKVEVEVIRGGKSKGLEVTLGQRDAAGIAARVLDAKDIERLKMNGEKIKLREKGGENELNEYTMSRRIAKNIDDKVEGKNEKRTWVRAMPKDENGSVNLQIVNGSSSVSVNINNNNVKVKATFKDKDGKETAKEFSGTREEVMKKVEALPEAQKSIIKKALDIKPSGNKAGSFQFRMGPMEHAEAHKAQAMKIVKGKMEKAEKAGDKSDDKSVRRIKVSGVIDVEEIMKTLPADVPPEVRESIEKTLRNIEIPKSNIKVERGQ